MLKDDIIS